MQLSEIIEFTSQISELVDNSIDIIESSIELDEAINRNKYIENEIKKFAKYIGRIYERINDTKNDDIYFESIGENYYIKNYIGFQNNGEFDKFYKINFNLYKKYFPNEVCLLLSITGLVLFGIIIIISLINIKYMYDITYKIFVYCCQFFSSILFVLYIFGFLAYLCVFYMQVYKDESLKIAKSIKSDEFINTFLREFTSSFENTLFIKLSIGLFSTSFFLHIIGIVLFFIFRRINNYAIYK